MTDTVSDHDTCQALREEMAAWDVLSDEAWLQIDAAEDEALVESGILDDLLAEIKTQPPIEDWERYLDEL